MRRNAGTISAKVTRSRTALPPFSTAVVVVVEVVVVDKASANRYPSVER